MSAWLPVFETGDIDPSNTLQTVVFLCGDLVVLFFSLTFVVEDQDIITQVLWVIKFWSYENG